MIARPLMLATSTVTLALSILLALPTPPARACTAVYTVARGHVFIGNNEDGDMPLSKVWVVSGQDGRYDRLYIGDISDTAPQGGINAKGLWFDSFSAEPESVATTAGEALSADVWKDKMMAECATVQEVLALLPRYQRTFLTRDMLMMGDRTGASVIIEGNAIVPLRGDYQIITNFRQSEHPNGSAMCERYRIAETMLQAKGKMGVKRIRDILNAVHQEGPVSTVYSYVIDLQEGKLHLYRFHDFSHPVVLDLQKELAKGSHTLSLQEVFPVSFAAEEFAARSAAALEVMKAARRYARFDSTTYPEYAGRYVVTSAGGMQGMTLSLEAGTDRLLVVLSDGGRRELIPVSDTLFSVWEPRESGTTVTFQRDGEGQVAGFVAHTAEGEIVTRRSE